MKPMEKRIESLEALQKEAAEFVSRLHPRAGGATLITLSGDLGAGKTAFTKAVAKALGVKDVVNSPTFVLEKIYVLSGSPFKRLIHIDAYRLEFGSELTPLRFNDLMKDGSNLIFLEWPEKVADMLPPAAISISLKAEDDGSRTLTYA